MDVYFEYDMACVYLRYLYTKKVLLFGKFEQ